MKPLVYAAGLILTVASLPGCATKCGVEPCSSAPVPVKSLEAEYGCQDTRRQLAINLDQTYTVIRSQADFDRLVTGPCHPLIDFSAYDLIIGKKGLSSGNSGIAYAYQRDCTTNRPTLHVTFSQGLTAEAPNITYHALVPKLAAGEQVTVELEVKQL
ncbi:hypothetical protein [Hymenobacter chitinivorans]|uniref:Lipoprotein n=1 Tax=Hymenobacter chitinivorans DSM 11115 TaxID=1121954 RepID=A0A2M9BN18_9BACT|nr:hypothetical protein [Hymenobacter chitinivorans]PJJ59344.1 hypothetical protein CLV45_0761 [Hymenobacter chitinivorans DSM 11115]